MSTSPHSLKTPSDILNAALAREKEAYAFYSEALKYVTNNESVRELLEILKDAEYDHVHKVEKMMAKLELI
jgi:rubrerythrin